MIRYDRPNANTSIEQFKRWVCARWPKQESKQFAVANGTFTSDSPDTNSVAWASCVVEYDSATYDITDGNTSDKYIYWDLATPTVFATSATIPSITENVIIVGTNTAGAFLPAWKAGQAAVVANSVSATALDGTTITGATVQTEATASRGIKLTSSSLKGYDGAGTETFSLTASDGSFTLTGGIYRTDASGARVQIDATNGLRTITSGGVTRGQFAADGSAYIQSAASGARTRVDTSGISAYSTDGQTVSINTSGAIAMYSNLTGARVEVTSTNGFRGLDSSANVLSHIDKSTGKTTNKSAASGARMEYDQTNGIRVYDSSGNLVSQWGPSTGVNFGTAYSGARVTFDATNGLCSINASGYVILQVTGSKVYARQIECADSYSGTFVIAGRTTTGGGNDIMIATRSDSFLTAVSLSDDNDHIAFYTGGTLRMRIESTAGVTISNASQGLRLYSCSVYVDGTKVVGAQGAAVADATGADDVVDQLNALLARCRAHGLIAT